MKLLLKMFSTTSWPSFFSFVVGQVKDFYTLAPEDRDALNKHMDCKMKSRGLCSGGRDREKECATTVIAIIPSQRGRPPKDPLIFVNTNLISISKTPLRSSI